MSCPFWNDLSLFLSFDGFLLMNSGCFVLLCFWRGCLNIYWNCGAWLLCGVQGETDYYFTLNNSSPRKQTIRVSAHNKNSLDPADLSRVLWTSFSTWKERRVRATYVTTNNFFQKIALPLAQSFSDQEKKIISFSSVSFPNSTLQSKV